MNVCHSTVPRRLQAMESQLGIKLFVRHPEVFLLTKMGETMVEREVLDEMSRWQRPIRISIPPNVAPHVIMPHLAELAPYT